jgi:EAL domain-containing protein (putative c-di-GMP-specific phosphodiesterase class I)/GGDEF domain-containing protein
VAEESDLNRRALNHALQTSGAASADALFYDPVTALPSLPLLLPRIREALAERHSVGILALNIAHFSKLEDIYGWETFDEIVRGVAACLKSVKEGTLRKDDALAELTINGSVFILLLSPPRTHRVLRHRELARIRARITRRLDAYLDEVLNPALRHRFGYFVGSGVITKDPAIRTERLVYRAIDEALSDATSEKEKLLRQRARKLRGIIDQGHISTVYQPIVDLRSQAAIGYEALSRGPAGEFQTPDMLFRVAYEAELVMQLERLCRERALRGLKRVSADQLMFINVEPISLFDPTLRAAVPAARVGQVVFELTEHAAITDFSTFRQATQLVKQAGFRLAIDDVGSAYSGLRVISEVEPDFIKLDMELTRGAPTNRVKMELIKVIAQFCYEAAIPMIVEGIETTAELEAIQSLGVHLVQGFLFGQPARAPERASAAVAARSAAVVT